MLLSLPTQKTGEVDLIDQRQVFMAFGVPDFIHADGVDLTQRPVLQTPGGDQVSL